MNLETIVGHEKIVKEIENAIAKDTFFHVHLIIGEDGLGKSIIAKGAAIKLLGKKVEKEYVDIIEWKTESKSVGVDEVRKIIEETNKKPFEGDKKIIIIFKAERMTIQAQNAFLKTIEEPQKGVYIFLLCENIEMIADTIKSRCQIHKLKRLNNKEMIRYIDFRHNGINKDEIKTILAFSDGIPGRADKFISDSNYKKMRDLTIEMLASINNTSQDKILRYEPRLLVFKESWQEILMSFISYIRDIMLYKETGNLDLIINNDKIDVIKELATNVSINNLESYLEIIDYTSQNLSSNVNMQITFDIMLLKMQEV